MNRRLAGLLIVLLLVAPSVTLAAGADLAAARALYAAASYEEALTTLASVDATEEFEQLHQLRALCLLALGRNREAEEAIERIVLHTPTYTLRDAEVSPKLVAIFQDVRRRTLPAAARALYAQAKGAYDAKRWADAKSQFAALTQLLSDPDLAGQQSTLADLKELGDGFLKLADSEMAAEAKRVEAEAAEKRKQEEEAARRAAAAAAPVSAAPTTAPAASQAPGRPTPPPASARPAVATPAPRAATAAQTPPPAPAPAASQTPATPIYTAADQDVTPPVEERRAFPRWSPPTRAMAMAVQTGRVEIVVDEKGAVTGVSMVRSVFPAYDSLLVNAAKEWRYKPAMREGRPVRYRMLLEVVLRPQQP